MSATKQQHEQRIAEKWTDEMREIVREFAGWMEEQDISQRAAARRLGVSPSAISQMLQEDYDGDAPGIADKMDRLLERHRMRELVPDKPGFVRTSIADQVHEACTIAHVERVIALVLGPTGVGKTMALDAYCEEQPETIKVEAGPGCSRQAFSKLMARAVGIEWHGSAYETRLELTEELSGTDRLLIVDECDYLPVDTLQVIRMIADGAGIGCVLCGTYSYLSKLHQKRSSTIDQFLGRVHYVQKVHQINKADIQALADEVADLDEDALDALDAGACGQARRAVAALVAARRHSRNGLNANAIRHAYETLMPVMGEEG